MNINGENLLKKSFRELNTYAKVNDLERMCGILEEINNVLLEKIEELDKAKGSSKGCVSFKRELGLLKETVNKLQTDLGKGFDRVDGQINEIVVNNIDKKTLKRVFTWIRWGLFCLWPVLIGILFYFRASLMGFLGNSFWEIYQERIERMIDLRLLKIHKKLEK